MIIPKSLHIWFALVCLFCLIKHNLFCFCLLVRLVNICLKLDMIYRYRETLVWFFMFIWCLLFAVAIDVQGINFLYFHYFYFLFSWGFPTDFFFLNTVCFWTFSELESTVILLEPCWYGDKFWRKGKHSIILWLSCSLLVILYHWVVTFTRTSQLFFSSCS